MRTNCRSLYSLYLSTDRIIPNCLWRQNVNVLSLSVTNTLTNSLTHSLTYTQLYTLVDMSGLGRGLRFPNAYLSTPVSRTCVTHAPVCWCRFSALISELCIGGFRQWIASRNESSFTWTRSALEVRTSFPSSSPDGVNASISTRVLKLATWSMCLLMSVEITCKPPSI